jgi:hypothetical protein
LNVLHVNVPYSSRNDTFTHYHLTDLHLGARACDEKQLDRDIARIANDPTATWSGGGDYMDAICQAGDKRYRPSTLAKWLHGEDDVMGAEVDYVIKKFAPIADKCLWLGDGNHEDAAITWYARNVYWEIVKGVASAAKKPPEQLALGVHGFVCLHFRRTAKESSGSGWRLTFYTHHGYGGGIMYGGHALTLGRVMDKFDCDIALLGHRHVEDYTPGYNVTPMRYGVRTRKRMGFFVASYLNSYIIPSRPDAGKLTDTYAEKKGYPPSTIGTFPIIISPNERSYHAVMSGGEHSDKRKPTIAGS